MNYNKWQEATPLLSNKWQHMLRKLIPVKCLCLLIVIIILTVILLKSNSPVKPSTSLPLPSTTIFVNLKQFQTSSLIPSTAHIGNNIIKQNTFNYTNSEDYIHKNKSFVDYNSFLQYGISIQNNNNLIDKGLFNMIESISKWITKSTNRTIKSFDTSWQFVASTYIDQLVVSIIESETSFYNKQFIPYLQYLLNNNELNNDTLLSMVDTFATKVFYDIDIPQMLQQGIASFGGGIGFGIQIYCNDSLIFDGGAGGGGGYNLEDKPNIFQFGGGGGIQINNISIGGGSGFERKKYEFDPHANFKQFHQVEKVYFRQLFEDHGNCDRIYVTSGGGSGGGFTVFNNTDLILWSYYYLNMIVE